MVSKAKDKFGVEFIATLQGISKKIWRGWTHPCIFYKDVLINLLETGDTLVEDINLLVPIEHFF